MEALSRAFTFSARGSIRQLVASDLCGTFCNTCKEDDDAIGMPSGRSYSECGISRVIKNVHVDPCHTQRFKGCTVAVQRRVMNGRSAKHVLSVQPAAGCMTHHF